MDPMYAALVFIIGFIVGGLICVFAFAKFSNKSSLLDELTKNKRELARAKRTISDFFNTADDLYSQFDKKYQAYTRFMKDSAQRLCPEEPGLFDLMEDENSEGNGTRRNKISLKQQEESSEKQIQENTNLTQTPRDFVADDENENDKEHDTATRI